MSLPVELDRLIAHAPQIHSWIADVSIKSALVLLLSAVVVLVLRRASAATRHLVWSCGLLAALLVPVLSAVLPGWHVLPRRAKGSPLVAAPAPPVAPSVPLLPAPPSPGMAQVPAERVDPPAEPVMLDPPAAPARPAPWQAWGVAVWGAGVVLLLARLAVARLHLYSIARGAQRPVAGPATELLQQCRAELGVRASVRLLVHPGSSMPMTWGVLRPCILIPRSECDDLQALRAIFLHEMSHVQRRDCLTQLLAQITCAAYWFNPLAWLAWRGMRIEREQACDDCVLLAGTRASSYAQELLRIASGVRPLGPASIAMARPGKLESRLRAILDPGRNRRRMSRAALVSVGAVLVMLVLPLALLRAIAAETEPNHAVRQDASLPDGMGQVVDSNGNPVRGARLESRSPEWAARTDDQGLFPLPPAPLQASVTALGFLHHDASLTPVPSAKMSILHPRRIVLERPGRVEGKVIGPNGEPLASAWVSAKVDVRRPNYTMLVDGWDARTDEDGRFALKGIRPGELLVQYPGRAGRLPTQGIVSAVPLTVADGQTVRNVVIDLSKNNGSASGRVLDQKGKPLDGAAIVLLYVGPFTTAVGDVGSQGLQQTDAEGRFHLQHLPPGSWYVQAGLQGITAKTPIEVGEEPLTDVDVVLPAVQLPSGRLQRVQPMDLAQTVREWIDATLAGEQEHARTLVVPGSADERPDPALVALLPQVQSFPMVSTQTTNGVVSGEVETNDITQGPGRKSPLKFELLKDESGTWLITGIASSNTRISKAAKNVLYNLSQGQFQPAIHYFDSRLKQSLPADRLADRWRRLEKVYGAYWGTGTAAIQENGGSVRVVVSANFMRGAVEFVLAFDPSEKITDVRTGSVKATFPPGNAEPALDPPPIPPDLAGSWAQAIAAPASEPARPTSAPATISAARPVLKVQTLHARVIIQDENKPPEVGTLVSKGRRVRLATPDGRMFIQDFEKGRQLWIDPSVKTAIRATIAPGIGYLTTDWFEEAIRPGASTVTVLPLDLSNGTLGFQYTRGGVQYTLWVDQKTDLPVRLILDLPVTQYTADPSRTILTDITLNAPVDDKLLALTVPEGYTVRDVHVETITVAPTTQPAAQR